MNPPFSQRYGYIKPDNIIIRECLNGGVLNSVYNFLLKLFFESKHNESYRELQREWWLNKLNLRFDEKGPEITHYIMDSFISWFYKLDLIEWLIENIRNRINSRHAYNEEFRNLCNSELTKTVQWLNKEFERHNYAYRIINDIFVETTSSCEIETINQAFGWSNLTVNTHLNESLKLLSPSNPDLSTRNAIKEAISAVEVIAREITSTKTLDEAFKRLTSIHPMINSSMKSLYHYTNQKDTGIRHGWMEQEKEPSTDEAIFVLVTSCAFINYLSKLNL